MKNIKTIFLFTIVFISLFVLAHLIFLISFSPTETFNEDNYFQNHKNKKVLAIVSHDDDLVAFSGTFAYLRELGWQVEYVSFYRGKNDSLELNRKNELQKVAEIQKFSDLQIIDFEFLKEPEKAKSLSVPYDELESVFYLDSLRGYIKNVIRASNPDIIFSLDDVIGGYGHAEHVIVAQSIRKVSEELKLKGLISTERIYQGVYPDSQEKAINGHLSIYQEAMKDYQAPEGMPAPNVQIPIRKYHREKMAAIKSYASQHNNLKKFIVYYHWYPSWLYFNIFNREFFTIIKI
ncbi:PIG-L family deacetylase [Marivirga sp. S37H4]|uniref:PIG-L family deacetylase n=1 Tax=Marivirga aurantiaca TaxID=2802615 RepID=A0A934X1V5_9BACT|nr:PIG-L family deacetylase [Marivirga aurantiaca]MBK6266917.1 PIG-L family deacetylase [Marivirga aurantiaca]